MFKRFWQSLNYWAGSWVGTIRAARTRLGWKSVLRGLIAKLTEQRRLA